MSLRETLGLRRKVEFIGEGSLSHRLWASPAITVLGIDAPPVSNPAHKLAPVARATISVRLAPGDDAHRAFDAPVEAGSGGSLPLVAAQR